MSNQIDATLAAFITQAIREAIAEERRADSRDSSRDNSRHRNREERNPFGSFGKCAQHTEPTSTQKKNSCSFGAIGNQQQSLNETKPHGLVFPFMNQHELTSSSSDKVNTNPNTKKVRISNSPAAESRYAFGRQQSFSSTEPTTTNSNVVIDSSCDIPNRNQEFKLIFQNPGRSLKPNEFGLSEPKTRPAQPNYPPPVYPGSDVDSLPELISDSEEEEPEITKDNKKTKTPNLADLQEAFDAQVPDAITGILSSLLGVDMTNELEGLADELLGTKKKTTSSNETLTSASATKTKQPESQQPKVEQTAEPPKKEFVSRTMFSDAYRRFVPYLFNELAVSVNVKLLIDEYLNSLVMQQMNEVNKPFSTRDPYYTKYNIHWKESSTRAVKAIATELSFSNRLAALEDMIKKMDAAELYKFKGFAGQICLS
jgi:hypothetical protein